MLAFLQHLFIACWCFSSICFSNFLILSMYDVSWGDGWNVCLVLQGCFWCSASIDEMSGTKITLMYDFRMLMFFVFVHTIKLDITFSFTPIIISVIKGHTYKKLISVHDMIFRFRILRYSILYFFVWGLCFDSMLLTWIVYPCPRCQWHYCFLRKIWFVCYWSRLVSHFW